MWVKCCWHSIIASLCIPLNFWSYSLVCKLSSPVILFFLPKCPKIFDIVSASQGPAYFTYLARISGKSPRIFLPLYVLLKGNVNLSFSKHFMPISNVITSCPCNNLWVISLFYDFYLLSQQIKVYIWSVSFETVSS